MEILLQKKKFTVRDSYIVLKDGKQIYEAISEIFSLQIVIDLFENIKDRPVISIARNSAMYEYSYNLTRWDNNVAEFRASDDCFVCYYEGYKYNLFKNKGRKHSVYKDDVQIAYWDKDEISYFGGNHYTITSDADASIELIVSLCIIVDNFSKDKDGSGIIAADLGHFGTEARPFDVNWIPKS